MLKNYLRLFNFQKSLKNNFFIKKYLKIIFVSRNFYHQIIKNISNDNNSNFYW